jgi:hypothetical protein
MKYCHICGQNLRKAGCRHYDKKASTEYRVTFRYSSGRQQQEDHMTAKMLMWTWEDEGDNTAQYPETIIDSGKFHHLNDDTSWMIDRT